MIEWFVQNRKNVVKCISYTGKNAMFVFLLLVVCSVVSILTPTLNMKLVNLYIYIKFSTQHIICLLLYGLLIIVTAFLEYGAQITRVKVENAIQAYINGVIIEDSINKRLANYCEEEATNTDVLIKSDTPLYQQFICIFLFDYPFMVFKVVSIFGILFLINPSVALAVLGLEILVTVLQRRLCKAVETQSNVVRNSLVGFFGVINDIVSNISMIRPIGAGEYLKERAKFKFDKYTEEKVKQSRYSSRVSLIIETLISVNMLIVLGIGSYQIYNGTMSVGAMLSLVQYVALFISTFTSFSQNTLMLHSVKGKIVGISDILTKHVRVEKVIKENIFFDAVQISDLSFSYSNEITIFNHASAVFHKGDLNCICGISGSGKSTLIKLMLGEYCPEMDECLRLMCDGKFIGKLKGNMIAYVPQQNVFFSDTILKNIILSDTAAKEDVYKVCKECSVYDEIKALEDGFDSIVSNSINNLSGGQIKRLSIARAILQDREILLLDEPTAGLDEENAVKVFECIRKYAREKLVIVITHDKYLNVMQMLFIGLKARS